MMLFRQGEPQGQSSDSPSEWSEDMSGPAGLRQHEQLCQVTGSVSEINGSTRRLARRKLLVACGISLVFMIGELIGERETKVFQKQMHPQ